MPEPPDARFWIGWCNDRPNDLTSPATPHSIGHAERPREPPVEAIVDAERQAWTCWPMSAAARARAGPAQERGIAAEAHEQDSSHTDRALRKPPRKPAPIARRSG